jgi:hypothetical protein
MGISERDTVYRRRPLPPSLPDGVAGTGVDVPTTATVGK